MKGVGMLCTKCEQEELSNGKCSRCDFFLRPVITKSTSEIRRLRTDDGEGIHDKCGYKIKNGKCVDCDR